MKRSIIMNMTIFFVVVAIHLFNVNIAYSQLLSDYEGRWSGFWKLADNRSDGTIFLKLIVSEDLLIGTVFFENGEPVAIRGEIANGEYTFNFPQLDSYNPDCNDWDVKGNAFLNESMTQMNFKLIGTFCYGVNDQLFSLLVKQHDQFILGDIDQSGGIDLHDAIVSLQIISGLSSIGYRDSDVNMDGKIGVEEAVYILQTISELR